MKRSRQHTPSFFSGKKALITGAGSGIGKATALKLAAEGASLVLSDLNADAVRQTATEAAAHGAAAIYVHDVNVAHWDGMQAMAANVHKAYGAMDILVNNAGVGMAGDFLNTTVEDWQWVLGINLMGVVHGCKLFAPPMVERSQGHIVNLASAAGYYAAPDMSAYSASKHAVLGLSRAVANEAAEHGVRCNCIVPGLIETPMLDGLPPEAAQQMAKAVPQGRTGSAEELAQVAAFLLSDAASHVTAQSWAVDGGMLGTMRV